jgi:hypothetical protein
VDLTHAPILLEPLQTLSEVVHPHQLLSAARSPTDDQPWVEKNVSNAENVEVGRVEWTRTAVGPEEVEGLKARPDQPHSTTGEAGGRYMACDGASTSDVDPYDL